MHYRIERLEHPVSEDDIDGLALLLAETVNSGSAVSFLAPLDVATAARWWRQVFSDAGPRPCSWLRGLMRESSVPSSFTHPGRRTSRTEGTSQS